jgi:hypothetical protein
MDTNSTVETTASLRLDAAEREGLVRDGYVVRRKVFNEGDCARIAADCEDLVQRLTAAQHGPKRVVGSYMFEMRRDLETMVKWEPDFPELLQGVEFFAHLSEPLRRWGLDPRMVEPARDLVGQDDVVPFTEKLNLKRARQGGEYILHQDFPYWNAVTPVANRLATAMVCLDEATTGNGCLQVAPGSHRSGVQTQRKVEGFGAMEMDPDAFDMNRLVPVEVEAGSVIFFGPFLVHRSLNNRSDLDRRALLYTYQPAGNPHSRELTRPASIRAIS